MSIKSEEMKKQVGAVKTKMQSKLSSLSEIEANYAEISKKIKPVDIKKIFAEFDKACVQGNLKKIENNFHMLLDQEESFKERQSKNETYLYIILEYAAQQDNVKLFQLFIKLRQGHENIVFRDSLYDTPEIFIAASQNGAIKIIQNILERPKFTRNVTYFGSQGELPPIKYDLFKLIIEKAAISDHLNLIKYMFEEVIDLKEEKTYNIISAGVDNASQMGNLNIIKYLFEKITVLEENISDFASVGLQSAARRGQLEIVQYMLNKGANYKILKGIDYPKETKDWLEQYQNMLSETKKLKKSSTNKEIKKKFIL